jgi:hypothetical protein
MDSNTVLGRIMTLLSLKGEEATKLAYAKLADGTILESPTFDVGESVEVVSEDGTKSPAPDGEHELELTGAEGETVRFKIFTEGGVITERENVELDEHGDEEEKDLSEETIEVDKDIPQALEKTDEEELVDIEEPTEEADLEEGEDEVTVNLEDVAKKVEEMAYRIEELEKKLEAAEHEEKEEEELEEDEEVEAKKLDGAPIEASKFSKVSKSKKLTPNYHDSVLSRMYNR